MEKKLVKRFVLNYLGGQAFLIAMHTYGVPNGPPADSDFIQTATLALPAERRGPWFPEPDLDEQGALPMINSLVNGTSTSS